jgi:hypothetical protein
MHHNRNTEHRIPHPPHNRGVPPVHRIHLLPQFITSDQHSVDTDLRSPAIDTKQRNHAPASPLHPPRPPRSPRLRRILGSFVLAVPLLARNPTLRQHPSIDRKLHGSRSPGHLAHPSSAGSNSQHRRSHDFHEYPSRHARWQWHAVEEKQTG